MDEVTRNGDVAAMREAAAAVCDAWLDPNKRIIAEVNGLTGDQIEVATNVARGCSQAIRALPLPEEPAAEGELHPNQLAAVEAVRQKARAFAKSAPDKDKAGGLVYSRMGSGGRCGFQQLREAVAEATCGYRGAAEAVPLEIYEGHKIVGTINYNSLDRIVTAFVDDALASAGTGAGEVDGLERAVVHAHQTMSMGDDGTDPKAVQIGDEKFQTIAVAFAKEFYGPGFDPFHNPEAYDLIERGLRAALQSGEGKA
jgi:hypothetical protein